MNNTKAINYITKRLELMYDEKKMLTSKLNKIQHDMDEIDERIVQLLDNVDMAMDVFSPKPKKNELIKTEVENLRKEKEKLKDLFTEFSKQSFFAEESIKELQDILEETIEKVAEDEVTEEETAEEETAEEKVTEEEVEEEVIEEEVAEEEATEEEVEERDATEEEVEEGDATEEDVAEEETAEEEVTEEEAAEEEVAEEEVTEEKVEGEETTEEEVAEKEATEEKAVDEDAVEENETVNEMKNVISEEKTAIEEITETVVTEEMMESSTGIPKFDGVQILEQQENERGRIARDLHDSVVQKLTNLVHKCEICVKIMDVDAVRAKLELENMAKMLRDSIGEMRDIIYDLRPMSYDDLGLDVILERMLNEFDSSSDMNVSFNVEGENSQLSNVIQITIFRIVQECVSNSIKYSNGTNLNINLIYGTDEVYLKIADDGDGFDEENIISADNDVRCGFGLDMMKERVALLSGNIEIDTKIGEGTTTKVRIPIS